MTAEVDQPEIVSVDQVSSQPHTETMPAEVIPTSPTSDCTVRSIYTPPTIITIRMIMQGKVCSRLLLYRLLLTLCTIILFCSRFNHFLQEVGSIIGKKGEQVKRYREEVGLFTSIQLAHSFMICYPHVNLITHMVVH